MQVLIDHGHTKESVLNDYTSEEIRILYEKCVKGDTRRDANFIENVMAGIGGAFGGGKEIKKLTDKMRE